MQRNIRRRGMVAVIGAGGGGSQFRWLRIDGGNTLRASPAVTGIKAATVPATVPAALDPGTVDADTGLQTSAPTGTFPDGVGYGTLAAVTADGTVFTRVLVRWTGGSATISGWQYWASGNTIDIAKDDASGSLPFYLVP